MDKSVVLDNKSFKALSAESRVTILKSLGERRMTLSELSRRLDLEASTVKEHCTVLSDAELIKMIDEGRKWKYYELTQKGRQLVSPSFMDEVKVLIVLCFAFVIFGGIIFTLLQGTMGSVSMSASSAPLMAPSLTSATVGVPIENAVTMDKETQMKESIRKNPTGVTDYGINYTFFTTTVLFVLLFGIILGWVFQKKIKKR